MTTAAFNEGIVGVRTSKSMVREQRNSEEFSHLTQAMYGHAVRNALYAAVFWPMMLSVCGIGTALALRFGGIGVIHGDMTLGALATFLQIVFFIQFPVQELTNAITQIQGAQASAERVQSLLDADIEIEDSPRVIERIREHAAAGGRSVAGDRRHGGANQFHRIPQRRIYLQGRTNRAGRFQPSRPGRASRSRWLVPPAAGRRPLSGWRADFTSRLRARS